MADSVLKSSAGNSYSQKNRKAGGIGPTDTSEALISDIATSMINGQVTISNWETYAGAAVGGAAGYCFSSRRKRQFS